MAYLNKDIMSEIYRFQIDYNCFSYSRLVEQKRFHSFERCGFSGFQEVVCCPTNSITQVNKFGR